MGVREVAGSNPVVPTISIKHLRLPALAAVSAVVADLWQTFSRSTRTASTAARLARSVACMYRRVVCGSECPISDAIVASLQPASASLVPNV